MSISAMLKIPSNQTLRKPLLVYCGLTGFCILFDRLYFVFGHGVESPYMLWLFLYPLLGGLLPLAILWMFVEHAREVRMFRLAYNGFNTALALLMVGSALSGVIEIAGTASPYPKFFILTGWILYLASIGLFLVFVLLRNKKNQQKT